MHGQFTWISIKSSRGFAKISMFLSGFLMGFVGLFVSFFSGRVIYSVVFLRGLFGFLWLFLIISLSGIRKSMVPILREYPVSVIMQSIFSAFTVYFYFTAIHSLTYAFAAFLLYLGPVLVVIFNYLFLRVKIPKKTFISFPIAILGLAILLNLGENFSLSIGIFNGCLSALCLAISTTFKCYVFEDIKRKEKKLELFHVQAIMPLFVCLFLIIIFIMQTDIIALPLSPPELFIAVLLGLFPTALAFTLYNIGLNQDKGGDIIILSYSEPLVASFLSILIQNVVDPMFYIGGSLIIIANLIIIIEKRRAAPNCESKAAQNILFEQ